AVAVLLGTRQDIVASEQAATPLRVAPLAQTAVDQRLLRRRDAHLDLTAHDLGVLLNRPGKLLVERPVVVDGASEVADLPPRIKRQAFGRQIADGRDAQAPSAEARPQRVEVRAEGTDESHPGNNDAWMVRFRHGNPISSHRTERGRGGQNSRAFPAKYTVKSNRPNLTSDVEGNVIWVHVSEKHGYGGRPPPR